MVILKLRNLCIVYERKTKDVYGRGPANIYLGLFFCLFDVFLTIYIY